MGKIYYYCDNCNTVLHVSNFFNDKPDMTIRIDDENICESFELLGGK